MENPLLVNRIINAKSHCEVLDINPSSANDSKIVKKAYRLLTLKVHPDKNNAPNAKDAFHKINQSYNYLIEFKNDVRFYNPKATPTSTKPKEKTDYEDFNEFLNKFWNDKNSKASSKQDKKSDNFQREDKFWSSKSDVKKDKPEKRRCEAKCKDGTDCELFAKKNSQYCHIHINYDPNDKPTPNTEKVDKHKCGAKCKDGTDCELFAKKNSQYCHIHINYDPNDKPTPKIKRSQCAAKTKSGDHCKKIAKEYSIYCNIHSK